MTIQNDGIMVVFLLLLMYYFYFVFCEQTLLQSPRKKNLDKQEQSLILIIMFRGHTSNATTKFPTVLRSGALDPPCEHLAYVVVIEKGLAVFYTTLEVWGPKRKEF